jgi:hypothetical protein
MTTKRRPALILCLLLGGFFSGNTISKASNSTNPIEILFIGDSFTHGRHDPALSYNWQFVNDMNMVSSDLYPSGTQSYPLPTSTNYILGATYCEPHPWGGIPGIFKQLTDEAGLNYNVSLSLRSATSLQEKFLNYYETNGYWNTRGNATSQKWDVVILQEQSSLPLPTNYGGNPQQFMAYAYEYQQLINVGAATNFSDAQIGAGTSTTVNYIPANTNANPSAKVYLEETWAYPCNVEKHFNTYVDNNSPVGGPIVALNSSNRPTFQYLHYTKYKTTEKNLLAMSTDLHNSFETAFRSNTNSSGLKNYAGVIPVGDAFMRAVTKKVAKGHAFYGANYEYIADTLNLDLWWQDRLHPTACGAYLSALTIVGKVTGINPTSFGTNDQAAQELGINPTDAGKLQSVASETLGYK